MSSESSLHLDAIQSIDVQDIRSFVTLARSGSFAAAATALGRDPTSLSRRLQSLERRLSVRLIERSTRAFALTEAGRAYLARVEGLLADLDAAGREASSFATGEPRGRLRLSLPGSFARLWLDPLIVGFLKAHPGISVSAHYSNAFVDILGEGFDVAVRLAELADSRLVARKVGTRRRLVCASPDFLARHGPITRAQDIQDLPCLCYTGRKGPFEWVFRQPSGDAVSVAVNCYMASDDADLLVTAARGGLGLFYTTDWHVGPHLASGELVELSQDWPVIDAGAIYVVTPAASRLSAKTRAFSDWIAAGLSPPPWLSARRAA